MKKKYFCTKCFQVWESDAAIPCPECKGVEVAEVSKDLEVIQSIIEKRFKEIKKYNDDFAQSFESGNAGGNGGKKTIFRKNMVKNQNGAETFAGMVFESIDHETEAWAKNVKAYFKGGAGSLVQNGERICKAPHGMNEGVPGEGGYLVPPQSLMNVIIEGAMNQSIFLAKAFKVPMSSSLVRIPRLHQHLDPEAALEFFGGLSWEYLNDGGVKLPTKPAVEYIQFSPYEHAALVPLTHSLIEDASINVVEWVTNLMIASFAYLIDHDCLVGNGAGKCLGIALDPNVLVEPRVTAGEVHLPDFAHMDARLNDIFDAKAEWLTRSSIAKGLRLDTTGGAPWWIETGYQSAMSQSFKPLAIGGRNPNYTYNTPAMGTKGDVILGPLDQYWLAIRKQLQVDESDHFYFNTNERCLRFVARIDGKPAIPQAFVILDSATATVF